MWCETSTKHCTSSGWVMVRSERIGGAMLYTGDALAALRTLPDESVQTCITSPPYFGLRDYGNEAQIGLEPTIDEYVSKLVAVFAEVRRVLKDDGTLWLNLGDSYAASSNTGGTASIQGTAKRVGAMNNHSRSIPQGLKPKDLIGIPWRVAFALQADGWYLRQDIIWAKPNPMPESVRDRCTKSHEYVFMLAKSQRYHYDQAAISEPAIYSGVAGQDETGFKNPINFSGKHAKNPEITGGCKTVGRASGRVYTNDAFTNPQSEPRGTKSNFGDFATRNKRSVWTVATKPYPCAHFATFPPDLIRPCVMAGAPSGGVVLDPFGGSGTTGMVALQEGRKYIGIELNPEYQKLAVDRITPAAKQPRMFA